jgi:aryl-alcohol dehydrogenase-like predicted oxidoreductase
MSVPLFNLAPNLAVSRLCLGTMTFGEQNTLPESFRLLDEAFSAGVNFFDAAEMYTSLTPAISFLGFFVCL